MFKIQELREIIRLIDQSSINEFTYENEGTTITLKKTGNTVVTQNVEQYNDSHGEKASTVTSVQSTVDEQVTKEVVVATNKTEETKDIDMTNLKKIESPMVGTFYAAPSPEEPAYVEVGHKVTNDTVVCIVEAMKLFNEIEAEIEGEIVEILVENGQLVEYGQPLFLVKPD